MKNYFSTGEAKMTIEIMRIFRESFQNVREHKKEWLRVAAAPLILWLAGTLFIGLIYSTAGLPWLSNVIDNSVQGTQNYMTKPFILGFADNIYHVITFISTICFLINGYRYGLFEEGGDRLWTLNLNWRF